MDYIFDLQVYVVSCHIQYMKCCVRTDQYVNIRYSFVGTYLRSENGLVSVSDYNDCASCFGIVLGFAIHISGID